jgi:uncharacterized membrane protein YagU involved in acid resistance
MLSIIRTSTRVPSGIVIVSSWAEAAAVDVVFRGVVAAGVVALRAGCVVTAGAASELVDVARESPQPPAARLLAGEDAEAPRELRETVSPGVMLASELGWSTKLIEAMSVSGKVSTESFTAMRTARESPPR